MNTLSLYIYLIYILPVIAGLFTFLFFIFIGLFVYNILYTKKRILYFCLGLLCVIITILIPDKKTATLIAASQIGEQILYEPEMQSIRNIIKNELKKYEGK